MSLLYQLQRLAQTIPVLVIFTIVLWSYYAFVVSLCGILPKAELKTFYLLVFHLVFGIFVFSYLRAIFSDPGGVPPQFYLTAAERDGLDRSSAPRTFLEGVAARLPVREATLINTVRYCEVCLCVKPDRAHHCSMCRQCVLKMDHHCPWINNCVGFRNYKFFVTFLLYSCLYTMTTALLVAPWAVFIWNREPKMVGISEINKFNVMILFFVAGMFFLAVSGLWVFHAFLTSRNVSTLEMGRTPRFKNERCPDRAPYDMGCRSNCGEVYGAGPLILCPVYTSRGNGVLFTKPGSEAGDMRRLLGTTGTDEEGEVEEETVLYDSNVPLNLEPVVTA